MNSRRWSVCNKRMHSKTTLHSIFFFHWGIRSTIASRADFSFIWTTKNKCHPHKRIQLSHEYNAKCIPISSASPPIRHSTSGSRIFFLFVSFCCFSSKQMAHVSAANTPEFFRWNERILTSTACPQKKTGLVISSCSHLYSKRRACTTRVGSKKIYLYWTSADGRTVSILISGNDVKFRCWAANDLLLKFDSLHGDFFTEKEIDGRAMRWKSCCDQKMIVRITLH